MIGAEKWGATITSLSMWKRHWSWITSRGWKNFKVCARRSQHCCEGNSKGSSVRAQKKLYRELPSYRIHKWLWTEVEIWMIKAILVMFQPETRNMLLDNGEKVVLVIKWQRTWLNYVHILCSCEWWNWLVSWGDFQAKCWRSWLVSPDCF